VGTFCVAAALTYDINRRVRVAERIVENKRTIQTSAPQYDATAAARRLARMMEAAEAGEFMGIDSLKEDEFRPRKKKTSVVGNEGKPHAEEANAGASTKGWGSSTQLGSSLNPGRLKSFPAFLNAVKTEGSLGRPSSAPSEPTRAQELLGRSKIGIGQTHGSDSGASTNSADATSQNNAPSLSKQMEELLDQDRPIEAAQLFLDTYSGKVKGMSSEMHELVLRTFYLNCKQENVFIARNVFLRLDEINEGSLLMWEMLLFALAKRGCIESVATLFIQFKHKFRVRPVLLDVLLRCLVEARRLSEAKSLLFGNLQHDRDCGLCGAYLAGLWRKTRSIELLNGQLRKLLNVLPRSGRTPSDKLFNPVLKAYIEFGKLADAEALVNLMMTKYKLPLRCRTKGLLVYGKSLNGDWEGVNRGLEEMCDSTTIIVKPRDFLQIFDRIFLEYWVSHTGPEIHDFIFYYIDQFRLVPDRVLYKHILEAFVEKGDENMMAKLTAMNQERSWKVNFDDKQLLDLLRSRRLALEQSPVGFWQMFQAARTKHGQSATSQRILGYDQRSFPVADVNRMPFTGSRLPWYERAVQEMTAPRRADNYQKLEVHMGYYMNVGKLPEALACFETAKASGFVMKQHHLELAMIAVLLQDGPSAAQAFIEAESESIQNSFKQYPEVLRYLMDGLSATEEDLVKMAVLHFYEVNATTKNMKAKHHITDSTSHRLMLEGKAHLALDLLATVYQSQYRHMADISSAYMKMFLRAFANLNNLQGVRWCILSVLSGGNEVKRDFLVEARVVMGRLKKATNKSSDGRVEHLEHITDLLEKKHRGDPRMQQLRSHRHLKRQSRLKLKKPVDEKLLFKQRDVRPTIESWDEEYELTAALGSAGNGPPRWTESDLQEPFQAWA
jgi:hypothetical protein